jgi:hypothetical protein
MSSISLPETCADIARRRAAEMGISPEEYLAVLVQTDANSGPLELTEEQRRRIGDELLRRMDDGRPLIPRDVARENLRRRCDEALAAWRPGSDAP